MNINKLAREIYEQNKAVGWWDDPNRCIYQTLQLVSTEIAEATEGERKDLMDDHLPHRKMGEVELADAMIRVLDIGGRYGWSYLVITRDCVSHAKSIAGKHLFINAYLIALTHNLPRNLEMPDSVSNNCYSALIDSILQTAGSQGYDLWGAVSEKLEYNKKRADHKRENRAKEGGKKF